MRELSKVEIRSVSGGFSLSTFSNTLTTFLSPTNLAAAGSVATGIASLMTSAFSNGLLGQSALTTDAQKATDLASRSVMLSSLSQGLSSVTDLLSGLGALSNLFTTTNPLAGLFGS
jgi:hypothetical protein